MASLCLLLLIAPIVRARQDDPQEQEGLRHLRHAAVTPLVTVPEERPPAPVIPLGLEWLQGGPLSVAELKGRVVLVEFWEFTCINCLRVLPVVESLSSRYGPVGLVAIGIHAPDFAFTADPALVSAAVKRLGITYPVVNDPGMEAWRVFDNNGWPSAYLIDREGRLAWHGSGEADYAGLEARLRALLQERSAGSLPPPGPDAAARALPSGCGGATPEVFAGHARGSLANIEGYAPGVMRFYKPAGADPPEGQPLLSGPWVARADGLSKGAGAPATLTLAYQAREAYVVLHSLGPGTHMIEVTQDGAPLGPALKGNDVMIDAEGHSLVRLERTGLYILATNAGLEMHRLELTPRDERSLIASFTFSDKCETSPGAR